MIEELKLISRLKPNVVEDIPFTGYSDIEYDEVGFWKKCSTNGGLAQNFAKAVLTYVQSNGYGTSIKKLLGKKNLNFIQGQLISEIISTINTLKSHQRVFINNYPSYDKGQAIGNLYNLKVSRTVPNKLDINVKISSLDGEEKNSQQLPELGFQVS